MAKTPSVMIQALKDAVQMELEGQQFYRQSAQAAKTPGVRQIFEYLAEQETYHIDKIQEIYRALEKDPQWSEALAHFAQPHERRNVFAEVLTNEAMGKGTADELDALRIGMEMEEKSVAYYNKLAREATGPLERRFFLSLVNEEREHFLTLLDFHNFIADPADWFFISEMAHVDGA